MVLVPIQQLHTTVQQAAQQHQHHQLQQTAQTTHPAGRSAGCSPFKRSVSACLSGPHPTPNSSSRHRSVPEALTVICSGNYGLYLVARRAVQCLCKACSSSRKDSSRSMCWLVSPTEFERHSGMSTAKKWRVSIRVAHEGEPDMPLGRWLEAKGLTHKLMKGANLLEAQQAPQQQLQHQQEVQSDCQAMQADQGQQQHFKQLQYDHLQPQNGHGSHKQQQQQFQGPGFGQQKQTMAGSSQAADHGDLLSAEPPLCSSSYRPASPQAAAAVTAQLAAEQLAAGTAGGGPHLVTTFKQVHKAGFTCAGTGLQQNQQCWYGVAADQAPQQHRVPAPLEIPCPSDAPPQATAAAASGAQIPLEEAAAAAARGDDSLWLRSPVRRTPRSAASLLPLSPLPTGAVAGWPAARTAVAAVQQGVTTDEHVSVAGTSASACAAGAVPQGQHMAQMLQHPQLLHAGLPLASSGGVLHVEEPGIAVGQAHQAVIPELKPLPALGAAVALLELRRAGRPGPGEAEALAIAIEEKARSDLLPRDAVEDVWERASGLALERAQRHRRVPGWQQGFIDPLKPYSLVGGPPGSQNAGDGSNSATGATGLAGCGKKSAIRENGQHHQQQHLQFRGPDGQLKGFGDWDCCKSQQWQESQHSKRAHRTSSAADGDLPACAASGRCWNDPRCCANQAAASRPGASMGLAGPRFQGPAAFGWGCAGLPGVNPKMPVAPELLSWLLVNPAQLNSVQAAGSGGTEGLAADAAQQSIVHALKPGKEAKQTASFGSESHKKQARHGIGYRQSGSSGSSAATCRATGSIPATAAAASDISRVATASAPAAAGAAEALFGCIAKFNATEATSMAAGVLAGSHPGIAAHVADCTGADALVPGVDLAGVHANAINTSSSAVAATAGDHYKAAVPGTLAAAAATPASKALVDVVHTNTSGAVEVKILLDGCVFVGQLQELGRVEMARSRLGAAVEPIVKGALHPLPPAGTTCYLCHSPETPGCHADQATAASSCGLSLVGLGPLMPISMPAAAAAPAKASAGAAVQSAAAGPGVVWVHRQCALWSPEVVPDNRDMLTHLPGAVKRGCATSCTHCGLSGATLKRAEHGCSHQYHLACAKLADWTLVDDLYTIRCAEHRPKLSAALNPNSLSEHVLGPNAEPCLTCRVNTRSNGKRSRGISEDGRSTTPTPTHAAGKIRGISDINRVDVDRRESNNGHSMLDNRNLMPGSIAGYGGYGSMHPACTFEGAPLAARAEEDQGSAEDGDICAVAMLLTGFKRTTSGQSRLQRQSNTVQDWPAIGTAHNRCSAALHQQPHDSRGRFMSHAAAQQQQYMAPRASNTGEARSSQCPDLDSDASNATPTAKAVAAAAVTAAAAASKEDPDGDVPIPEGEIVLGGTTGQPGRAGRCAVCVVQRKGRCGTESAPKKCLRRQLLQQQRQRAAAVAAAQRQQQQGQQKRQQQGGDDQGGAGEPMAIDGRQLVAAETGCIDHISAATNAKAMADAAVASGSTGSHAGADRNTPLSHEVVQQKGSSESSLTAAAEVGQAERGLSVSSPPPAAEAGSAASAQGGAAAVVAVAAVAAVAADAAVVTQACRPQTAATDACKGPADMLLLQWPSEQVGDRRSN